MTKKKSRKQIAKNRDARQKKSSVHPDWNKPVSKTRADKLMDKAKTRGRRETKDNIVIARKKRQARAEPIKKVVKAAQAKFRSNLKAKIKKK